MPLPNRVTPFNTLIATPARGTLMGNRGCLHDAQQQIRRDFRGQRWIICVLDFKGRQRTLMTPGHYTELFFLDEATALTAGHRPCAECQRARFHLFRDIWASANPGITTVTQPAASVVDAALHQERRARHAPAHRFCHTVAHLPDGTFVTDDEQHAYVVLHGCLLRWTPAGYMLPAPHDLTYPARVLTPASVVRTLAAGYPVTIHTSAFQRLAGA
jgi:hypothetical protein